MAVYIHDVGNPCGRYVLIYCTDDPTADMLAKLLTVDQVKAVLISERNQVRRFSLSFLLFQNCISDDHLLTKTGLG
jgi:uncharacterized protein YlbG (UPF0298 family)